MVKSISVYPSVGIPRFPTMVQNEAPQLSEGEEVRHVQEGVTLFIDEK